MDNELQRTGPVLDIKRDMFAEMVGKGNGIVKSYRAIFDLNADDETAMTVGLKLSREEEVRTMICEYYRRCQSLSRLNKEYLAVKLKDMIDVNVSDYFEEEEGSWTLKPVSKWTAQMKTAFEGMKMSKFGVEYKFASKLSAIETLSKMMGYDREDSIIINDDEFASMTDKQLEAVASTVKEIKSDNGE